MLNTVLTELSTLIKFVREKNNFSKSEFASRLNISTAYVTALESGEKTIISNRLSKLIQDEFGVSMGWVLKGKGNPSHLTGINPKPMAPEENGPYVETQIRDISVFERLLSEISATYINLPAVELKKVLRDDFGRLSQALGGDGCILYMGGEDQGVFHAVNPFCWFIDESKERNKAVIGWLNKHPCLDVENFRYGFYRLNRGEPISWENVNQIPSDAEGAKQALLDMGVKSTLAVPISFAGSTSGILNIFTTGAYRAWPEELIPRIRIFGEVFINALMRKQSDEKLQEALSEIQQLKERFEADYLYLREEIDVGHDFSGVVGKSGSLNKILIKVKQVAPTNATVLILGETGTGKGLIARAIHDASQNKDRPLMQINCAALAPTLIESELFGHEKGAFTGAANGWRMSRKPRRAEGTGSVHSV